MTKVLYVEDNADTLRVMTKLMRLAGFEVYEAATFDAALRVAATTPVDVLVTDIGIGDRSGVTLLREVMKLQQIPAIAVTGYCSNDEIQRYLDAGFLECLAKPFDFHKLREAMQRASNKS